MPSVRIVIVNYRTAELTSACLRTLVPEVEGCADCRVTVVDGGSGDGSAERLTAAIKEEGWADWVEVLPLTENRGFAAGNNAALRPLLAGACPPDYVILLNPDTLVHPGAVRALVAFMEANPKVGIAGSRLENPDGTVQNSAFRFPSVASEFDAGMRLGFVSRLLHHRLVALPVRNDCHRADWVSGASAIVRRQVFDAIGLLDEGYFLYYEETDFCLRARRAGWQCWYVPNSRVVHLIGQSTGMNEAVRVTRRMPRYWFDSRRRFFDKGHGPVYRMACDAARLLGFALWRLRRRVQGKPDRDPPGFLHDLFVSSFRPTTPCPR